MPHSRWSHAGKQGQERWGFKGDSTISEQFTTQDLWLSGLFFTETDAKLVDIQIARSGRETVIFSFRGENLAKLTWALLSESGLRQRDAIA